MEVIEKEASDQMATTEGVEKSVTKDKCNVTNYKGPKKDSKEKKAKLQDANQAAMSTRSSRRNL